MSTSRQVTDSSKKSTIRLDTLLVERNLAQTAQEANGLIMSGKVYSDNLKMDKPGEKVKPTIPLRLKLKKEHGWVSRGGLKLEHALKHFSLDVKGMTGLDVGASTGGFTEVLLHYGVDKVYAVDVGYGELAWKLQKDERVVVKDRTNARDLDKSIISEAVDIVVSDVSFISLTLALPKALALAKKGAQLVALIKPQFEVRKEEMEEGGIIRDPAKHEATCEKIRNFIANDMGWEVMGLVPSPIKGMEGNTEFLITARKP